MRRMLLAAAAVLSLAPAAARAQSKTGTAVGQFLLIEPSARVAAMGNAGVALGDGIQSVYYNPGGLGGFLGFEAGFTHSEWLAGISYDYAAAVLPVAGIGDFFGSVTVLNSGDISVRTVDRPLGTGEKFSVTDLALGFGYGRAFSEKLSAGVQLNFVQETIWHTSMKTATLNVGAAYRMSEDGLRIGASISNYGALARFGGRDLAIQYDNDPDRYGDNSALPGERLTDSFPLPVLFRVGAAMPVKTGNRSRALFAADASHPSDNTENVSAGAEWTWMNTLSLRAGYQNLFMEDSETGPTLGAGAQGHFGEHGFSLDYAWADHGRLDQTHRLTFVVALR
jgi:long-subunit fatty acid transport protein